MAESLPFSAVIGFNRSLPPARSILAAFALGLFVPFGRAQPPLEPRTFNYKEVGTLEIRADVYPASSGAGPRPVVVWIHGGALIVGGRQRDPGPEQDFVRSVNADGCVFVSIDYRLAPETKLPDMVGDVVDAFHWIRREGPRLFQADPARIGVIGSSAGAYLTLVAGFKVEPRPRVLVSLWGFGDLVGPWCSEPSTASRFQKVRATREEAWRQVSGPPIANAIDRAGDGGLFNQYCRRSGDWSKAVSGWDPRMEAAKFFPYMPLKNVAADYPPTLLVHGTADTGVPCEQSRLMAAELGRHGIEHELIEVPGGEHGLKGADPALVETAWRRAREFLRDHLSAAPNVGRSHPNAGRGDLGAFPPASPAATPARSAP